MDADRPGDGKASAVSADSAVSAKTPAIEIRLTGRFVVLRDGAEIPAASFNGRKVRTLLRILASRQGQFVARDELTELLWPDRPPADPVANIQVLVNRARRATQPLDPIVTGPGGYALTDAAWCVVDTEEFCRAVAAADALPGRLARPALAAALAGLNGDALAEDRYEAWARPYRDRIAAVRQEAWERAAQFALDADDVRSALEHATRAALAEPLRERPMLLRMRALDAVGDHAAALRSYDSYRRALAAELGVDPSAEAEQAYLDLLAGTGPRPAGPAAPTEHESSALRPFDLLAFTGRTAEAGALRTAARPGQVVAVAGRSGAGKSRLVREALDGCQLFAARAYWSNRSEPWSLIRELLAEVIAADVAVVDGLPPSMRDALASVLPELEATRPASQAVSAAARSLVNGTADSHGDAETRRALVTEAAVRIVALAAGLSAPATTVIVADDVQWADPTSAAVLGAIAERVGSVAVALAYRPEDLDRNGTLATLLQRTGATVIALQPFTRADLAALIADDAIADALIDATDGTPMAISEVLRALHEEALAEPDAAGIWHQRDAAAAVRAEEIGRAGQRHAIARRVALHDEGPRRVLHLLALLGREASARVLAASAGLDETATLDALTMLAGDGLVRLGEGGWAPAHDMVAEVVADGLTRADAARLHRALAEALSIHDAEHAEHAEVARHWQQAGEAARATEAFADAAQGALAMFAMAEAEELADAGLRSPAAGELAGRLHAVRGAARAHRGDIAAARADLRQAAAAYPDGPRRAVVLADLAMLASGADDLVRASELAEAAIVAAGASDALAAAHALEVASVIDMNLDRGDRAALRADRALELYAASGESRGRARVLDARAMATFLAGDIDAGADQLERAANLFEDSGDLLRAITPRSTAGHAMVFAARPAEGLLAIDHALELATRLGQLEGQSYAHWHRVEALVALERLDEAGEHAQHALDIARRLGHRGWTATAWRAVGIAQQARGDLDRALDAFQASLESSAHLHLFACWAAARAALTLTALGRLDDAEAMVDQALADGPPLGQYEARWAWAELAAARRDADAVTIAIEARRLAEAGGMRSHLPRLAALCGQGEHS